MTNLTLITANKCDKQVGPFAEKSCEILRRITTFREVCGKGAKTSLQIWCLGILITRGPMILTSG